MRDIDIRRLTVAAKQLENAGNDIKTVIKNIQGAVTILQQYEQNVTPLQGISGKLDLLQGKLLQASQAISSSLPQPEHREPRFTVKETTYVIPPPSKIRTMGNGILAAAVCALIMLYFLARWAVRYYFLTGGR